MKINRFVKSLISLFVLTLMLTAFISCAEPPLDDPELINITKDSQTGFSVIYDSKSNLGGRYAFVFKEKISSLTGASFGNPKSDATEETELEILLGNTNRQLSRDLKATVESQSASDSHVWGFAYRDGKFAFYYNSQIAFERGLADLESRFIADGDFIIYSNTQHCFELTLADYEAELKAEAERIAAEEKAKKEAELEVRLEAARTKYSALIKVDYEDIATLTPDSAWSTAPKSYPKTGEHPRVVINSEMIPKIKAWLEDEKNKLAAEQFWKLADSDTDGTYPDVSKLGQTYNYDGNIIAAIEAKALAYVLTKNAAYGWEAIVGVKNIANTLVITEDLFADLFRGWGYAMYVTAEVYDWCYDLMTDSDREHMIAGVQQELCKAEDMTIGFPPSALNHVAGHGTNCQIQRDYLAFSIAIYDEHPDWYEYVGRRLYSCYVPVNSVYYEAGFISQGTSCYVYNKYYSQLFSEYLIKTMGGAPLYDSKGIEQVMITALCHLLPNGYSFQTGDGTKHAYGSNIVSSSAGMLAAALFNNTTILASAKHYSNNYTKQELGISVNMLSSSMMAIFAAQCDEAAQNRFSELPLVQHNGSPIGQVICRNSWNENAAVTFMKIGELTNGNHEHQDSGTFQIYYNGLLTTSSGMYSGDAGADYGSIHHQYYHQGTIAQNGLLIYNPAFADTEPKYNTNGNLTNAKRYWYSGGQIAPGSPTTVEDWLIGKYNVAKTVGYATDYNATNNTVSYAYIAGDLTASYHAETVDRVERRMLTVYTDNEKFPMIFVVYDNIASDDANFKKTFLLHTVEEPQITGNRVSVTNGDGKLVLQNLMGGDSIKSIGGENKTYWVNDYAGNADIHHTDPNATIMDGELWGRVEISTVGALESEFLNFMYVTNKSETSSLTAVNVQDESGTVSGGVMDKFAAVFIKSDERRYEEFSFVAPAEGQLTYFISGVYHGKWDIYANGNKVTQAKATKDGGLLTFKAPAGEITVKPSDDFVAPNSGTITYLNMISGALLPEAPQTYTYGTALELPSPTHQSSAFLGWYTTGDFKGERVTEISADQRGDVKLYAKWQIKHMLDFTNESFDVFENATTRKEFSMYATNKTGASFKTVTSPDGNTYLEWVKGELDPEISIHGSLGTFMDGETVAVYSFSVAKAKDKPIMAINFRLKGNTANYSISAATVSPNGEVYLNGNTELKIMDLTEEFQDLIIEVDFKNSIMTAYSSDGSVIQTTSFAPKEVWGYASTLDWMKDCNYIYDIYVSKTAPNTDSTILLDNLAMSAGSFEKSK